MVETIRFEKSHLKLLDEFTFGVNSGSIKDLTDAQVSALERRDYSFTIVDNWKVLGCAGITEAWPGRAEAWAILDKNLKSDFIKAHNQVKKFLENVKVDRVEAIVEADFKEGLRWVKSLGFKREALMKKFGKQGQDSVLFSRVRGH